MSSVRSEYQRFLAHLATVPASDNARRMANLIMVNLARLAEVGAGRRARSTRLAPLAVAGLMQTPPDPPPHVDEAAGRLMGRLHRLEVGPFRGFMRQEIFDLERDITLIYGANGTGKSSFCEALETAMLGSITEAQVKRVDHRTYCNNARLRRHVPPHLTSLVAGGEPVQVTPNEDDYRFCFIEKNRLDDFARIAARTPGDQRQLIATLFGVDQFNDFVRGFNPSLDDDLNLVAGKAFLLDARRTQLAASEQIIRTHPEKQAELTQNEHDFAQRTYPGNTFTGVCQWMLGTPEQQGRLPWLQAALEGVPPVVHGITQEGLRASIAEVYRIDALWRAVTAQLAQRANEVSYSQLYNALLGLPGGATACPACGTDLNHVAHNPFEHARASLQQLAQLAQLQSQEQQHREELNAAIRALHTKMQSAVHSAALVSGPDLVRAANLPGIPVTSEGNWLTLWVDQEQRGWTALLQLVAAIEQSDAQAQVVHDQRRLLVEERVRLDALRLEIERLKTLRKAAEESLAGAQTAIAQFDQQNAALIAEVATEAAGIEKRRGIKDAYDEFLPLLQAYLASLPAQLLQGLAAQARDLYNSFNRDDPPSDLLHALHLPMAENGKIELEFIGGEGTRYDALVLLSEGHIKCLGLAILLAKNLAQGCPVLIFDDVVNAIDDEHRNGIWRTLFDDGILDGKQIILTSHAEEFLLRIQQELGAERVRNIRRYKFLPHLGEHELRVDSDPPIKNYVLLSQQALAQEEKRDALRHARPAIESLTDQIWTWLGRRHDGKLEIALTGPRAKWELNNKCTKLRGALRRIPTTPAIQTVIEALDRLLGINGTTIEWGCLNTGTHDAQQDHEFDRATVRVIVEATTGLDAGLAALRTQ